MALSVEDITAADVATLPQEIKDAMYTKFQPDFSQYLTGKDFVVLPKTEHETTISTAVETARNAAIKEAIGTETANFYNGLDATVGLVYGRSKPQGMKSYDWVQQLHTEGLLPLKPEALELVKKATSGNGGGAPSEAVAEQLRKDLATLKEEQQQKETANFQKTVNRVIATDFNNAPIALSSDLKDASAKSAAKTQIINDMTALFNVLYEYQEDDKGTLYAVKKGTTQALMNATENRAMTPTEIIRQFHPMYLRPEGYEQAGGGSQGGGAGGQGGGAKRTPGEIRKEAIEVKGFAVYSPDFNKYVEEEMKKAGLKL